MTVTLATPPSGPNEQIDTVNVSLFCEGIDPVLGVPRPAQSSPETFTINVSTSQGAEPYNTIGLFEKQGLPAGPCHFEFFAVSNSGNTECAGKLSVVINTDWTTQGEVVLACVHAPRYGGVNSDGSFNQCAEYRQILVTPTTQAVGSLVDIATEVYDPDGDDVTVAVQTAGACGNVATVGSDTAASCETVSGCEAVVNTVECTGVGLCEITVAVSDDGFSSCDGLLPDGSSNDAARSTIAVDCTAAEGEPPVVCEYEQDFEALDPGAPDALQSDQWLYFGSVFDGTGAFKFGFGPFPAPTTNGQVSAIATGQGGAAQGNNQLLVFSNYDCCQPDEGHFGTDLVDTLVFQEINPILASDIGRTFTFTFDAKRGDIGGNTTAEAYILTLDPDAGFAITSRAALDTTSLPTSWGTYSITLPLTNPALEGQILQFGFITTASNFEPAGNLYDNISFCAPGGGGGGPGIELRPLPQIYTTGTAINYGPFRAGGPGTGEIPTDAQILQDLQLLQTAGYDLIRLFGADAVSEKILRLAEQNFPEMRFQQGLFLEGMSDDNATNCLSAINDSQVATAIQLANDYPSVVTVSVGNETSLIPPGQSVPLNCLEGYITEVRDNVTQPITANDDYTFYAGFTFGRKPDTVLQLIDFVSIHTYPFLRYQDWDWKQEAVPAGDLRAKAMMDASLVRAQQNYQSVYNYRYRNASGVTVTLGETWPIVIGETGWKWRQTDPTQEIETYAANPVNAKWYKDLMATWERSPGGPVTVMDFVAFDEAWKLTDDGWGFWDAARDANYALCDTPAAGAPCNVPLYDGAGFFTP